MSGIGVMELLIVLGAPVAGLAILFFDNHDILSAIRNIAPGLT